MATQGQPGQSGEAGHEGVRELSARIASIPQVLRENATSALPALEFSPRQVNRIFVTGVGSSAGHAHFLAEVLSRDLSLPAAFVSTGSLALEQGADHERDVLVVFSQGLSPNARFALSGSGRWGQRILVTGVGHGAKSAQNDTLLDREEFLDAARRTGIRVVPVRVAHETGMLVRVVGPMTGYLVALQIKQAIAEIGGYVDPSPLPDVEVLCGAVEESHAHLDGILAEGEGPAALLNGELVLLAAGGYGRVLLNLATKFLEGMSRPLPPIWDLLEFSHGGFQQFVSHPGLVLAFTRNDMPHADDWFSRARGMLDSEKHHWLDLRAKLPWPHSVFEHEAYVNALLLAWLEETNGEPREWPGQGLDHPLYDLSPPEPSRRAGDSTHAPDRISAFDEAVWPEIEAAADSKRTLAVVPLGSTEQHGPHLPLATDSWIAQALAEGFCERVKEALRLPVLPFGCADEHLGFPGTLSLRPEHLEGVLADLLRSLESQGIRRAFLVSAHGGNIGPLRGMMPALRRATAGLEVIVFDEWEALVEELHALAASEGISPEAAGHHAGEVETSILESIAPNFVRHGQAGPGLQVPTRGAQEVFYPDLRKHSASGVVGDGTGADAARGARYLECWIDRLVEFYRAR